MPWRETDMTTERTKMMLEWQRQRTHGEVNFAALCRQFRVSRTIGYKWLSRFLEANESVLALLDQSKLPKTRPNQTPAKVEEIILEMKRANPKWGPRKILKLVRNQRRTLPLPSKTTVGKMFSRHGLAEPRRKPRHKTPPYTYPFALCTAPNMVWCADFKGWFRTSDGVKVYPLTITDAYSRLIICCIPLVDPNTEHTMKAFKAVFRQYGLPNAIRTDNGPPFASVSVAGLSELSVWWIKQGIIHERIAKGKPQQNGRHERMHGTIEREIGDVLRASPYSKTAQILSEWKKRFNCVRPHEALNDETPMSRYVASARIFPCLPQTFTNHSFWNDVADDLGAVSFCKIRLHLAPALRGERIDFHPAGQDELWKVSWYGIELGTVNVKKKRWTHAKQMRHIDEQLEVPRHAIYEIDQRTAERARLMRSLVMERDSQRERGATCPPAPPRKR